MAKQTLSEGFNQPGREHKPGPVGNWHRDNPTTINKEGYAIANRAGDVDHTIGKLGTCGTVMRVPG